MKALAAVPTLPLHPACRRRVSLSSQVLVRSTGPSSTLLPVSRTRSSTFLPIDGLSGPSLLSVAAGTGRRFAPLCVAHSTAASGRRLARAALARQVAFRHNREESGAGAAGPGVNAAVSGSRRRFGAEPKFKGVKNLEHRVQRGIAIA